MSDEELAQVLQSIPVPDRREDWRRIARELKSPVRLAGKVARYFTLFKKRA